MMTLAALIVSVATASDLQGRYALSLHTVTRTRLPFVGWTSSVTTSDVLVDIRDGDDGARWQRQEVCDVRVSSRGASARIVIPDAFVASLPIKEVAIDLTPRADGTVAYRADLGVDDVGFDSARARGSVPRTVDDPAVIDSDLDGKPGATIRIQAPVLGRAELYVVQRGSMILTGTLLAEGGAAGAVTLGPIEQHTVAASNNLLVSSPRIEPVSAESWFRLTPIAPTAGCEDISLQSRPSD